MQRERPGDPVREVEEVHALIDQLAAARPGGLGSPLAVVSDPAAVAVARPQVHQLPVAAGMHLVRELGDRRVKAMVEPDLHHPAGVVRGLDQPLDLRRP